MKVCCNIADICVKKMLNKESAEKFMKDLKQYTPLFHDLAEQKYAHVKSPKGTEMTEIFRCIKLYCLIKAIPELTVRKTEVLAYYLQRGYNTDTKKYIRKEEDITDSNLNVINHQLRKMGYLVQDGRNETRNKVSEELSNLKNHILKEGSSNVIITFL
jgi:hypothetical protein